MLEQFNRWDTALFLYLNECHHPTLDPVMSLITHRDTWIPFYLLLIFWLAYKLGWKKGTFAVLFLLAAVGASDFFASGICKPFFERLRPCHQDELKGLVHLTGGCGGRFGFMSSHAANSFALAFGLHLLLGDWGSRYFIGMLYVWAILQAYSRIYTGVHFPGDVIAGMSSGLLITRGIWFLYGRLQAYFNARKADHEKNAT